MWWLNDNLLCTAPRDPVVLACVLTLPKGISDFIALPSHFKILFKVDYDVEFGLGFKAYRRDDFFKIDCLILTVWKLTES
jgi:hypothetical protein